MIMTNQVLIQYHQMMRNKRLLMLIVIVKKHSLPQKWISMLDPPLVSNMYLPEGRRASREEEKLLRPELMSQMRNLRTLKKQVQVEGCPVRIQTLKTD